MTTNSQDPNIQHVTLGRLTVEVGRESFRLLVDGVLHFDLSVRTSVDPPEGEPDVDEPVLAPEAIERDGRRVFVWRTRSNHWSAKQYELECYDQAVAYRVHVTGSGPIGHVSHFSGGTRPERRGSTYEVARYLVPSPGGGGASLPQYPSVAENRRVELHYLAPPMLALPFQCEDGPWLTLGLAPRPGHYHIDHVAWNYQVVDGNHPRGFLSTDYMGYTAVDGTYEVAAVVATVGDDEYASLGAQANWLYDHGGCRRVDRTGQPRWWYGPLFCGWGEQGAICPGHPLDAATQANYTRMSQRLDELNLKPSAIIIDDKWMTHYGEALPDPAKWPDLRAFTDAEHAKGRRVMLWFKAWNTEGLPVDECVNLWTQPCGADPTNPRYQTRVRELMHTLLSSDAGCYDCDGFKVDFANVMPLGLNLRMHERCYGIELLKRWFTLFYESAKAVKSDCLVNASCAHPYFAEVVDQARLHDYYWGLRSAWTVMQFRQRLFRAAMPGVLIDTDGVASTHTETMAYARRCVELGVPDLYFLTGGGDVQLTEADLAEIAAIWHAYAATIDRQFLT